MLLMDYFNGIRAKLREVETEQQEAMLRAADEVARSIKADGLIFLFGSGHSHILAEEMFYRAGGLAPVRPILPENLMLHKGAFSSSKLERQNGYASTFMKKEQIGPNDVVIVISTSGINPVPIDVALIAKEKGAFVIGLTSRTYSEQTPSKHESGYRLYEVVDLVLDNRIDKGDAMIKHEELPMKFGPGSTVIGACMLNGIFVQAINQMVDQGLEPPVFLSGNAEGTDVHNTQLITKYRERIPFLS